MTRLVVFLTGAVLSLSIAAPRAGGAGGPRIPSNRHQLTAAGHSAR
jgi:hypothetical protein